MTYTPNTTGPWECNDPGVLCNGAPYLGPTYPWLDGVLFDPWDVTELDGSRLVSVTSLGAYASGVSRGGTYLIAVTESGSHDYVIEKAGERGRIDKDGNSAPAMTKAGSP